MSMIDRYFAEARGRDFLVVHSNSSSITYEAIEGPSRFKRPARLAFHLRECSCSVDITLFPAALGELATPLAILGYFYTLSGDRKGVRRTEKRRRPETPTVRQANKTTESALRVYDLQIVRSTQATRS